MSDIESNHWNDDKKQDPILSPHLIEKPLIEDDKNKDFDDLRPRQEHSHRWGLTSIFALVILVIFFYIIIKYWIQWS